MSFKVGTASCLRFNKDFSCFSCCTSRGIQIFNTDPLQEKCRITDFGTFSIIQMMARTNFVALVSGGKNPVFPDSTVNIWDDAKREIVAQLEFTSPVLNVRMKPSIIVVVLASKVHIFNFLPQVQKLATLETRDNITGLCELCPEPGRDTLVIPALRVGSLQILHVSGTLARGDVSSSPMTIAAHRNPLIAMALDYNAYFVATASTKGTLIRVFDLAHRTLIAEFRRGADTATLYSISFSLDTEYLCVSSDKGTVHVWAVKDLTQNKRSNLRRVAGSSSMLGGYVHSHWALATFTTPAECPTNAAFVSANTIVAICSDGSYYKYIFSRDSSGIINRELFDNFIQLAACSPENDF